MKEVMKNCIVRKIKEVQTIGIDDSNQMLRRTNTEQSSQNRSPYRLPHQLMISPAISQKTHPPSAREFHRVTEEGVHLRRKSLVVANKTYKLQQEAKDRARTEQREAQTETSQ
ncbi:hypothetical protein MKW92_001705, partial [Papaver armeniacum]